MNEEQDKKSVFCYFFKGKNVFLSIINSHNLLVNNTLDYTE